MKIESLNSNIYSPKQSVAKETPKTEEQTQKQSDSLEISAKAQELSKTFDGSKKLELIKAKIQSGFYNSDEIMNKVADAILKEINS